MGAHLGDAAPVEHHQPVGVAQGGEAMGDGEGGAPLHQREQAGLDQLLGLGVDRRGGFVQDQYARVVEDGAGDGDALALAAGEPLAAFSPTRVS